MAAQLTQIRKGIINDYEMWNGSRMVRISEDTERQDKHRITVVAYVNRGETACRSRDFGTLKGASKWATNWLGIS